MKIQDIESKQEGWRPTEQEVIEFLKNQDLCSIATLSQDGRPQIARVAFSVHDGLRLAIGTQQSSRKAQNIMHDNRIAVEVTDADGRYTVQYEGLAHIASDDEFVPYESAHYDQLPASRPFKDQPGECNIMITPTWVRFSDCNPFPWVLTEFEFDERL